MAAVKKENEVIHIAGGGKPSIKKPISFRVSQCIENINSHLLNYEKMDLKGLEQEAMLESAKELFKDRIKVIVKERIIHLTLEELDALIEILNGSKP